MAAKVGLIGESSRIAEMLFVVDGQGGIALCAGDRGKAGYADGVEGTVSISSVREKNNGWSGHRAGSFLVRLKRSPLKALCLLEYITIFGGLISSAGDFSVWRMAGMGDGQIRRMGEMVFRLGRGLRNGSAGASGSSQASS
jgi:hypothetical protein